MSSAEPDYERVYRDIRTRIAAREAGYLPNERLPSIVALAAAYNTSPSTVKIALVILRETGFTVGRQGKGTFVAEHPPNGGAESAVRNV